MEIFTENPNKSFKINRKSPLANKLKLSISDKLLDFLGSYTDDVLAEYITVLVCNGKNQNQARDDLEAFLGERSGDFVSWLWDLLKVGNQSSSTTCLLDPIDLSSTSPNRGDTDRDLRSNRSKVLQNHNSGIAESSRGLVTNLDGVNTNKVWLQTRRSAIQRDVGATENLHDDCLTNGLSRKGGSSVIPAGGEQNIHCMDESKQIVKSGRKGLRNLLSYLPRRETVSRNVQSSVADTRQICAASVSVGSPPRAVGEICEKKSRGSVWDRLGKPCENSLVSSQTIDTHKQDQKAVDQHIILSPPLNEELSGKFDKEVKELDKTCTGNNIGEYRIKKHDVSTVYKLHGANNIGRKRHFGEISTGLSSGSVCLVGESSMDPQCKESLPDVRALTLPSEASETTKPALVSQVRNVKERLHQIELEMSRLRSKQLEMKKGRQPNLLSSSGAVKHSEEDVESRTVFVTNVHFAATKEALSLYFAKCGVVLHVVILTDILLAPPKGSAYITFASKESVDKAIALSGTSFFSRHLKVLRKTDEAAVTSLPTQLPGKLSRAPFSQINRKAVFERPSSYSSSHLRWRWGPVSATSQPPASITNEKRISTSTSFASNSKENSGSA